MSEPFTDFVRWGEAGISLEQLGAAISVWSWTTGCDRSVADAAAAFNVRPTDVLRALMDQPYVYFESDPEHTDDVTRLIIMHDGE